MRKGDPEKAALLNRATRAETRCTDLAAALREAVDAHYHWREHGEGRQGAEADTAAQRFIEARKRAHALLADA